MLACRLLALVLALGVAFQQGVAAGQSFDPAKLPGVIVDDDKAEQSGEWRLSTSTGGYFGAGYLAQTGGDHTVRFELTAAVEGVQHLLVAYTPGANRSPKAPYTVLVAGRTHEYEIDQRKPPQGVLALHQLDTFELELGQTVVVEVTTRGAPAYVIVDAVALMTADELAQAREVAKTLSPQVARQPAAKPAEKPAEPAIELAPFAHQPPSRPAARLTAAELDRLFVEQVAPMDAAVDLVDDDLFLRRVTLDLTGRQPTLAEQLSLAEDTSAERRANAVERLLASREYADNWANYWIDTIGSRQQEPELTFHNYEPFRKWLADQLADDRPWDEIVYRLLTAQGKVGDNPAASYIGFHQGNAHRLAGETTRLFLGMQIACAECHDHPFVDMPQEVFHGVAAYFVRVDAKIAQNDSNGIELKSKTTGEQKMPGAKQPIAPRVFDSPALELGADDLVRRDVLARWITAGDNPYFARAYVNRVWSRLLGRGFFEPVDNMGDDAVGDWLALHERLAEHFVASGYDHRDLMRLLVNTQAYQRRLKETPAGTPALASAQTKKLRGDEVFDSLAAAIDLPNITPPPRPKTGAERFPPPPKSTRDLVSEAFGYDPSLAEDFAPRTLKQAMFLMNNRQVQARVAADGEGSLLKELLANEADDAAALTTLFRRVLARRPTEPELKLLQQHIATAPDRAAGFEDVLWSLLNSTEFTTRR